MKLRPSAKNIPLITTTAVCVILYIAAGMRYNNFASLQVFADFFNDYCFLGIAAVGLTFVILSGGIDLSVGAVIALTSVLCAVLVEGKTKMHPAAAAALLLFGGALFGLFMGTLVTYFKLPPFLVTLGGMFLARGIALVVSEESIPFTHPLYLKLSEMGIPIARLAEDSYVQLRIVAVVYLATVLGGMYLAHFTTFGRTVYAIGGNENAASLMGLNVNRGKIGVYVLSGFCSALAGVVFTVYNLSGFSSAGIGLELDAIAAVVIGGTLLTGGVGYVAGTFVGVLIFAIINAILNFQGNLDTAWTKVAIAFLLLCFILLQKLITRTTGVRKL